MHGTVLRHHHRFPISFFGSLCSPFLSSFLYLATQTAFPIRILFPVPLSVSKAILPRSTVNPVHFRGRHFFCSVSFESREDPKFNSAQLLMDRPPFNSTPSLPKRSSFHRPRGPSMYRTAGVRHNPPVKAFSTGDFSSLSNGTPAESYEPPSPGATPMQPFIIGVTGASASGKTTVCEKIIDGLGDQRCVLICVDWFYHSLPEDADSTSYNFDHPTAFDFSALLETLEKMRRRKPVSVPTYNFEKHMRDPEKSVHLDVADVIIVEGILTFYDPSIRDLMHMKVFVDEDPDICLSRRIVRDVQSRGRTVESVLSQYTCFVKPAFEEFVLPTKRYADIVMPRGGENLVVIDMIIKHIAVKIRQNDLRKLFPGLVVMSDSFQTRGLHTIIRDMNSTRNDIVFYSDRLMRLLVEEGLGLLPFKRQIITTNTGSKYAGVGFIEKLAAVSILPAGVTMENSVRAVCKTIRFGKMLIGSDGSEVTFEDLPEGLSKQYILVLAPVLNTGKACETVIARLVSKVVGCEEDRVLILSMVVSPQGVMRICSRFPRVRLVVSAIDKGLDDNGQVYPGIGDFATRYFGMD